VGGSGSGGGDGTMVPDTAATDVGASDLSVPITDGAPEKTAADVTAAQVSAADVQPVERPLDGGEDRPVPNDYAGLPWNNMPQTIPGMILAPFYDQGGEGIAYHDVDPNNKGADQARAIDPIQPEATFRANEGVDLRSTRAGMDKYVNGENLQSGRLYVGWTDPGEWVNYTVNVAQTGHYTISALVATLNDGTRITFTLEDGTTTGPRPLPWTHSFTAWRFADNIASLDITAGHHVLQVRFETTAINVEYLSFVAN
jgi:hypothetical protein